MVLTDNLKKHHHVPQNGITPCSFYGYNYCHSMLYDTEGDTTNEYTLESLFSEINNVDWENSPTSKSCT